MDLVIRYSLFDIHNSIFWDLVAAGGLQWEGLTKTRLERGDVAPLLFFMRDHR